MQSRHYHQPNWYHNSPPPPPGHPYVTASEWTPMLTHCPYPPNIYGAPQYDDAAAAGLPYAYSYNSYIASTPEPSDHSDNYTVNVGHTHEPPESARSQHHYSINSVVGATSGQIIEPPPAVASLSPIDSKPPLAVVGNDLQAVSVNVASSIKSCSDDENGISGGEQPNIGRGQPPRSPYDWVKRTATSVFSTPAPGESYSHNFANSHHPLAYDEHRDHHHHLLQTNSRIRAGKTRTRDKYRVVYSELQRTELEKEFLYSRYITIRRKAELAQHLQLSERQVSFITPL